MKFDRINFRITEEQKAFLDGLDNKSKFLRNLVDYAIQVSDIQEAIEHQKQLEMNNKFYINLLEKLIQFAFIMDGTDYIDKNYFNSEEKLYIETSVKMMKNESGEVINSID